MILSVPVEDGPGADGKDEKFEREGDEKAIALNLTTINFDAKSSPNRLCVHIPSKFLSPHT